MLLWFDLFTKTIPLLCAEFIYCGKVLCDDGTLEDQNIRNGSTIHVLQKKKQAVVRDMTVTEAEIEEAHRDYNSIADYEVFCVRSL